MKAVLYTHDLEPITVVELSMFLWERLRLGDTVQVPVMEPVRSTPPLSDVESTPFRVVRITGDLLCRRGKETLMLFTVDEEHALALQAAFLPGQIDTVRSREQRARIAGFLAALSNYG